MKQHLNTLFVTTDGAYLRKDGEAVAVRIERKTKLRVPLHHLGGIVCFGRVGCSPQLMGKCASAGVSISLLTEHGRLQARIVGFTSGNVLLRREQYRRADDVQPQNGQISTCAAIVRPLVIGKLLNCRSVLLRAIRDYPSSPGVDQLRLAARQLASSIRHAEREIDMDRLRGIEGDAASVYFKVFPNLINRKDDGWDFKGRSRRPPLDPVNALLSFLYTILMHDARSACEVAGLDSQVGFLHRDRPGRPSLALDLMEEMRAFLCDRLALTLINRRQIQPSGFTKAETGGFVMNETTRKAVLNAYQKRKQEDITHPFLNEKICVGLIVHIQARLLARHLRGDIDAYPPFVWQ